MVACQGCHVADRHSPTHQHRFGFHHNEMYVRPRASLVVGAGEEEERLGVMRSSSVKEQDEEGGEGE